MAIDTVPPLIAAQISYLTTHCPFAVKVEQMWSGCKNPSLLDRFTVVIPFCLDFIKWDVIYNAMYPLAAPDIIFGPEDEMFQPYSGGSGKSSKNSLANWNSRDPSRLLSLIIELRNAYMAYQRRRIGEVDDERLKFEISTMLPREGIEMYMSSGTDKPGEARFAIPLLDMDLNKLVAGSTWRQPQKIYLQVVFPVCKKYSTAPPARLKLISSAELKALFSIEDFKLPTWLDGMCTAEYLPVLEEKLGIQIKEAVASIEARRTFIMGLAPVFGRPIEADPVHFSISLQFPKQQPAIILQSSQHFNSQGAPIKSPNITQYPWSPRWRPSQMADRLFEFLADESLNFKKKCNQLNPQ
ncbi:brca1-a complex subunit bre [Phtheirospermum japonicum]|uniref:BRISC and BRCA1-A complex member 2 n=1 Tax=Phtheirospermum japonicum TaxID=374723 RepID=A0A830CAI3_9LAMI|nr:brca1-a complex subunit bre [Phtheirospermum japonicum]